MFSFGIFQVPNAIAGILRPSFNVISPKGMLLPLDDGLLLVIQKGGNKINEQMSSCATFLAVIILYFSRLRRHAPASRNLSQGSL